MLVLLAILLGTLAHTALIYVAPIHAAPIHERETGQGVETDQRGIPIVSPARVRKVAITGKRKKVQLLVIPQSAASRSAASQSVGPQNATSQPTTPPTQSRDCYQAPPLTALSASISLPAGKMPTNAAAECAQQNSLTGDTRLDGRWVGSEPHWSATCSRHRPLYFEEINAERYGYTASYTFQPVISAAHFFGTIPLLPYKMAVDHPRDCNYTLGHYRPGSCAPRCHNRLPKKIGATAVEAGFIAGLILLVP